MILIDLDLNNNGQFKQKFLVLLHGQLIDVGSPIYVICAKMKIIDNI